MRPHGGQRLAGAFRTGDGRKRDPERTKERSRQIGAEVAIAGRVSVGVERDLNDSAPRAKHNGLPAGHGLTAR